MTKQEEIREVIDAYTDDCCLYPDKDCKWRSRVPSQAGYCNSSEDAYKCLMVRLGELGVVIAVEGENVELRVEEVEVFGTKMTVIIPAGYAATEPLIEG